ncbi:MAG: hypothetical protein K8U57_28440 [Planctomycetes bacterium]|nr:hypothetical protein [Planctomycetota bacterium]
MRPGFERSLPSVLVAHLHVRGAEGNTLYKLSERDDVTFEAGYIPTPWEHVALGHIHKPQCHGVASHIRYRHRFPHGPGVPNAVTPKGDEPSE